VIKHDRSNALGAANIRSLIFIVPPTALLGVLYLLLWGWPSIAHGFGRESGSLLPFLGLCLLGIVAHEAIHGIVWAMLGSGSFRTIEFGVNWKALTPYAHSTAPMTARIYRWGAVMPALVLGLVPSLVGLATGNGMAMAFGIVFTAAAGGDFLILWLLRGVSGEALVEDHPTRGGCLVLEPDQPGEADAPVRQSE
jgi:hypothetical protein